MAHCRYASRNGWTAERNCSSECRRNRHQPSAPAPDLRSSGVIVATSLADASGDGGDFRHDPANAIATAWLDDSDVSIRRTECYGPQRTDMRQCPEQHCEFPCGHGWPRV